MADTDRTPFLGTLHGRIFVAMAAGVLAGLIGGEPLVPKVAWMGTLFVRLLRMIIVPLVIVSIVSGVATAGGRGLGRLFVRTWTYYAATSLLAILLGLVLVNALRPGETADLAGADRRGPPAPEAPGSVADLLLGMVPTNPVRAAADGDMLGLILFCILFAASTAALPDAARAPLLAFFDSANAAMMRLTAFVVRFAPLGVFGLMTRVVGESGFEPFRALGLYALTIVIGITIHMFGTLPLLLVLLGRIDPRVHFRNMAEPLAMAFSTSSSGATLPVTMRAVEGKAGVSNRVASFVLPMGATVNMDGTALYECAGVLFIAQALGVDLTVAQQGIVVVTALLASIGAAAVPSAGLVMIFLVLEAVHLRGPDVDAVVGMMLAIDRPLDMYRTAVNVFSDTVGAVIIAKGEGESEVDAR